MYIHSIKLQDSDTLKVTYHSGCDDTYVTIYLSAGKFLAILLKYIID